MLTPMSRGFIWLHTPAVTGVVLINLRIPKPRRGSYFPEDLIVRYSRHRWA